MIPVVEIYISEDTSDRLNWKLQTMQMGKLPAENKSAVPKRACHLGCSAALLRVVFGRGCCSSGCKCVLRIASGLRGNGTRSSRSLKDALKL